MLDSTNFENLVLTICQHVRAEHLATVKLNKLIWLIDKTAMCETGQSVTGVQYIRKPQGPVPCNNIPMLNEMRDKDMIAIAEHTVDDGYNDPTVKRTYKALKEPQGKVFSAEHTEIIKRILKAYGQDSTRHLVHESHDLVWASFDDGEIIPLEAYMGSSSRDDETLRRQIKDIVEKEEQLNALKLAEHSYAD